MQFGSVTKICIKTKTLRCWLGFNYKENFINRKLNKLREKKLRSRLCTKEIICCYWLTNMISS